MKLSHKRKREEEKEGESSSPSPPPPPQQQQEKVVGKPCGSAIRVGQSTTFCQEPITNAIETASGLFVCPCCQATFSADYAEPFLPDLVADTNNDSLIERRRHKELIQQQRQLQDQETDTKRRRKQPSSSQREDGSYEPAQEKKNVPDRAGHIKAASTTIDNCIIGLGLPVAVGRLAKSTFEKLLDFCNSAQPAPATPVQLALPSPATANATVDATVDRTGKEEKMVDDGLNASNAAMVDDSLNSSNAAAKPKKVKRPVTKISGRRMAFVIALVELCAYQHGTPRLHTEIVRLTGQSSTKIHAQHKNLETLAFLAPQLGLDFHVRFDRPSACLGFAKLLLARLFTVDFKASVKEFSVEQIRVNNDVLATDYFQRDLRLQALWTRIEGAIRVVCNAPAARVDAERSEDMDVKSDTKKVGKKKEKKTKIPGNKLRKNKEAILAAAVLLAMTQSDPLFCHYFSYAIFKEWFHFFTKAISDCYDLLRTCIPSIPLYQRRSKIKTKKPVRGTIPPRQAN
jgi:hypothetical protein